MKQCPHLGVRITETVHLPDRNFKMDWFPLFWNWVKNKDLALFERKLIFPVKSDTAPLNSVQFDVVRLHQSQPVLYISSYTPCPDVAFSVMDKFGIQYCTQATFDYVEHRELPKLIKCFCVRALLESIVLKQHDESVKLVHEEAQYLQSAFIDKDIHLFSNDITFIKKLQIFSTCANSSNNLHSINDAMQQSILNRVVVQPTCTDY